MAMAAFFCAAMVSFREARAFVAATRGFGAEVVGPTLLVKDVLLEFGLDGSFSNSCFDFASRPDKMLDRVRFFSVR